MDEEAARTAAKAVAPEITNRYQDLQREPRFMIEQALIASTEFRRRQEVKGQSAKPLRPISDDELLEVERDTYGTTQQLAWLKQALVQLEWPGGYAWRQLTGLFVRHNMRVKLLERAIIVRFPDGAARSLVLTLDEGDYLLETFVHGATEWTRERPAVVDSPEFLVAWLGQGIRAFLYDAALALAQH